MKKILGINISHNCSFAFLKDGTLKEYYEEERFNYIKDYMPEENNHGIYDYKYKALNCFKDITFDMVIFASYNRGHLQIEMPIVNHILTQVNHKDFSFYLDNHHIYHAICGLYFSKFNEAIALISDGGGENVYDKNFKVLQSIYLINKHKVENKYRYISNKQNDYFNHFPEIEQLKVLENIDTVFSSKLRAGLKYIHYLKKAGFNYGEEGQLMGIAAYKNGKNNLDKEVLEIANTAQEETLNDVIELIEKAKTYSDCKNIILSGGYHLNCSNNFKLVKLFPEYNFFVDPICYDGGTAVGAALYYENYL